MIYRSNDPDPDPRRRRYHRYRYRHNPVLAEYLLGGNPRHLRRYRRNPEMFSMRTLTNPMPLLTEAAAGLTGIYVPLTVGNMLVDMLGGTMPQLMQPGIMGSLVRAIARGTVAWGVDQFALRGLAVARETKSAFRVGAAIGIGGSLLMDLLGRPLLIGPGDAALGPTYIMGGLMATRAPAVTGTGAYFRQGIRGTGLNIPYPRVSGDIGAYFRRGISGTGATARMFSPMTARRIYG